MKRKDILLILLLGIVFVGSIVLLNKIDNDFIEECTNGGHSKEFCEKGIRGE